MSDNIPGGSPEGKNMEEGVSRELTAIENVIKRKELLFVEVDGSNLDILTYLAERHMIVEHVRAGASHIIKNYSKSFKIIISMRHNKCHHICK